MDITTHIKNAHLVEVDIGSGERFHTIDDKVEAIDHSFSKEIVLGHPIDCNRIEDRWYYIPRNSIGYENVNRIRDKADLLYALETTKPKDATIFWISDEKFVLGNVPQKLENSAGDGASFWKREFVKPSEQSNNPMRAYRIVFFGIPVKGEEYQR